MAAQASAGADPGSYGTLTTDVAERKAGMVRATQAYLWSQTQAPGATMGGSVLPGAASGLKDGGVGTGAAPGMPRHVGFPSQTQSKMLAARVPGGGSRGEEACRRFLLASSPAPCVRVVLPRSTRPRHEPTG